MRIKRGQHRQRRHKKVLKLTKGFQLSYGTLYKRSKEALLHAGQYSFGHRRQRRSEMKSDWLRTISAGLSSHELSYSKFINGIKNANIELNSKMLAQLALEKPEDFAVLVEVSKKHLK